MTVNHYNFNTEQSKFDQKIDDLLDQMTIEEKVGQMIQLYLNPEDKSEIEERIRKGLVGSILTIYGVENINRIQKMAVEESRLGIPLIIGNDVIHGYRTIFPIPLAESCTWDPDLIENTARIAAEEATSNGVNWTFAPMVDICRDPRWGRIAEGSGEDPYLGSVIARARVRGFQSKQLKSGRKMVACPKHFAAYGWAEAGKDYNTTDLSDRVLKDFILPPFKAAFDEGAGTTMSSFNDLNGIPASCNSFLLQNILRDELRFNGFVVSDWNAIGELIPHGVSKNLEEAAKLAVNAGIDMDMASGAYHTYLVNLLKDNIISEEVINHSVRRILNLKMQLGLFEQPFANESLSIGSILNPDYREKALEAARKSMVLVKNENNLLPLKSDTKIALIGPLADDHHEILGTWHRIGKDEDTESIFDGMKSIFKKDNISYVKGCKLTGTEDLDLDGAIHAAQEADIVVMVLGEGEFMSGESNSRAHLRLPGQQQLLLETIHDIGKPIVVVLLTGRPLVISWMDENIPAILVSWHSGIRTGLAVAEILSGLVNPSGKLTTSWPRTEGQIPIYYNHKNTGRPPSGPGTKQFDMPFYSTYIDEFITPLYPFGFGLSYAEFVYSNLKVINQNLKIDDSLRIEVTLQNKGDIPGEEIVQLYIRDLVGEVTRPVKELKGFKKVWLEPKESRKILFSIPVKNFGFHGLNMNYTIEPGEFKVWVGPNSSEGLEGDFQLI